MSVDTFYDSALVSLASVLKEFRWKDPVEITLVRDAIGQLSATLSADESISLEQWQELEEHTRAALQGNSAPGRRLWRESELLAPEDIVGSVDRVPLTELSTPQVAIYLVDRLLSNQDWLRPPLPAIAVSKIAVAYSIKGGVGRTTAFGVLAWWLALKGLNVALLDLDLESPGAGSALLDAAAIPDYGIVDWLHARLTGTSTPALDDCWRPAAIAQDADGRVRVSPAYGRKSQEYIAKLGRLYQPTLTADRSREGFAERLHAFVSTIASELRPDVILLDSRAGLDDIGAAAVTRLGAEVFVFSRNETQSWDGYRQLFAHLSHSRAVKYGMHDGDLRWRMKMVLSQADDSEEQQRAAIRTSFEVWSSLYDDVQPETETQSGRSGDGDTIQMSELDESAPHFPVFIPFNSEIRAWRLSSLEARPSFETMQRFFGAFCEASVALLDLPV